MKYGSVLLSLILINLSFISQAFGQMKVQETAAVVEKVKELRAACKNRPFHEVITPSDKELSLQSYLKIKNRCTSGNLNQVLNGVKNQNRLEKMQIAEIKKMPADKKVKAAKERIDFVSASMKETLSVAEVYIHLLWLREYASIAKRAKSIELKEHLKPIVREIRENQKKIYQTMLMHDSDILINEFASVIYGDQYGEDEKKKAEAAMNMHWKLKNEISNSSECLALQKCFICVDKIQNAKCDQSAAEVKKLKEGAEKEYTAALVRYGEAAASLEKLIARLEKAIN